MLSFGKIIVVITLLNFIHLDIDYTIFLQFFVSTIIEK